MFTIDLKSQNFQPKIDPLLKDLRGHLWQFWGSVENFLVFSKIDLELFRKCLGIVFDLKRPTFVLFATRN